MAKKTWIKVKRGILKPKHRKALGIRVWLYMHMLDIVDWESGIINKWRDKDAAEDLDMPWRTVQDQRQHLETDGYITCEQSFQCLRITIHKWVNPRKYSGEVLNIHGTESSVSPTHGTEASVPAISGDDLSTKEVHGTEHGTEHPTIKFRTPIKGTLTHTTESQLKDSRSNDLGNTKVKKKRDPLLDHPAITEYRDEAHLHVTINWRKQVAEIVGDDPDEVKRWRDVIHDWMGRGWNKQNIKGMLEVFSEPEKEIESVAPYFPEEVIVQ